MTQTVPVGKIVLDANVSDEQWTVVEQAWNDLQPVIEKFNRSAPFFTDFIVASNGTYRRANTTYDSNSMFRDVADHLGELIISSNQELVTEVMSSLKKSFPALKRIRVLLKMGEQFRDGICCVLGEDIEATMFFS